MKRTVVFRRLLFFAASTLILASGSLEAHAQCEPAKQQQALAALGTQAKIELDQNQIPTLIQGRIGPRTSVDPVQSAIATLKALGDVFCVSADDDFVFSGRMEKEDKLGQTHVRVHQTYHGLPVVGPELIVHMTRDSVILINGHFVPRISVPTEAVISSQEASRVALDHIAASGATNGAVKAVRKPVVFVNADDKAYLAYPVQINYLHGDRSPGSDELFVDAIAGIVVGRRRLIWAGRDREIYDANFSAPPAPVYQSVPLLFGEGGSSSDDTAYAAYYNLGFVYDYYWNVFGRDSYDGKGAIWRAVVHYGNAVNNAYWDDSEILFGDGDGISFFQPPAFGLDIVAHEATHAVTYTTAGLDTSDQSAALNESFSDALGESTECHEAAACDWKVGESVYRAPTPCGALRCMYDPPLDGRSVDYYPQFKIGGDEHDNAGIANLAYYLLVQGGSHPEGYTNTQVQGIGVHSAEQIWYRALTIYLQSGSGYVSPGFTNVRNATVLAAADLYGSCNQEWQSVQEAWDAVGVPGSWSCSAQTQGEWLTTLLSGKGSVYVQLLSGQLLSGALGCGTASSCRAEFSKGSSVNVTAVPPAGSSVTWTAIGPWGTSTQTASGSSSTSFAMTGPVQYAASFGTSYRLTVNVGTGTINGSGVINSSDGQLHCTQPCSALYAAGTKVTLNPVPDAISFFENWAGDCAGKTLLYTLTMNRDKNCTAWFLPTLYNVQVFHGGTGSGTVTSSDGIYNCGPTGGPVCSNNYKFGTTITLTATPDQASTFVSWSGTWLPSGRTAQAGCYNYVGGNQCVLQINSLVLPVTALPLTATFLGNSSWWPAVDFLLQ